MKTESEREAWALACNRMEWACAGKDGFDTRAKADQIIAKMLRTKRRFAPGKIASYRCPYCNKWHIGGQ